jgi:cob(I)alamin adenosyltransferase
MKIYTKTGDKGETGLFGAGRISKDSLRIEAYGTVDELNSFIGLSITESSDNNVIDVLRKIQNQLFTVGSDLAAPKVDLQNKIPRTNADDYIFVEQKIDFFVEKIDELKNFILPGGCKAAALLHVARTICRRAERKVVALNKYESINSNIIIFLNRISDLLFILARYENKLNSIPDVNWEK